MSLDLDLYQSYLHKELRQRCKERGLTLHKDLEDLCNCAFKIWEPQMLTFFTDHQAQTHSLAIVGILDELLKRLQATDQKLNAPEIFILLAASYLHDIGMQDLQLDGRGVNELTVSDYEAIRRRHPEQGAMHIRKGTTNIEGIDPFFSTKMKNSSYSDIVAEVSHAHGSEWFETCVAKLKKNRFKPGGESIRPTLLAALLMLADELHIDQDRANFGKCQDFSPTSSLHFHVNHYVTAVDNVQHGNRVSIELSLEWPSESNSYRDSLRFWIARKLTRQIRRVNVVLREACEGALEIEEKPIKFYESIKPEMRRKLPDSAKAVLKRDVDNTEIVGRRELLEAVRRWLELKKETRSFKCIIIWDTIDSDWPKLNTALENNTKVLGGKMIAYSFDQGKKRGGRIVSDPPENVLWYLNNILEEMLKSPRTQVNIETVLKDLASACSDTAIMLLLEHPNCTDDEETRRWLSQSFLPALKNKSVPLCTVIVVDKDKKDSEYLVNDISFAFEEFTLSNFTVDDIAEYLSTQRGFSESEAREKAEIQYAFSGGGIPKNVLAGLGNAMVHEVKFEVV